MLSFLSGTIHSKEVTGGPADRLVMDVAGVGFELSVSRRTLASVGQPGDPATVHVALVIRESEWTLFGFSSAREREMFGLVQSVNGVGPKMALALVGTLGPEQLAEAVAAEDEKLISQTPGVGAKIAQRLILELGGKLEEWSRRHGAGAAAAHSAGAGRSAAAEEVRAILEGLGYTPTEIHMALKQAGEKSLDGDVEQLVRFSLKLLGASARS